MSCLVAIKLQPPTAQLTLHVCQHAHQRALRTKHYPLYALKQLSYVHKKHKAKWYKMYKDVVNVL